MLDALKTLFQNDVVLEVPTTSKKHGMQKLRKTLEATPELREEFAKKYEHDKETMVKPDAMMTEKLAEEIAEFEDSQAINR